MSAVTTEVAFDLWISLDLWSSVIFYNLLTHCLGFPCPSVLSVLLWGFQASQSRLLSKNLSAKFAQLLERAVFFPQFKVKEYKIQHRAH